MVNLKELLDKSSYSIRNEGLNTFVKKSKSYVIRHIKREKPKYSVSPDSTYMDVLFINGCFLPHPSRYRVSHQREQLLAANMVSNEVFYEELTLDLVKNYRAFIFFRCPFTETIGQFIKLAKELNKIVIYDIDDLVIDTKYTDNIKFLNTLSEEDKKAYDDGVRRMQKTLLLCDAAITTTERLAKELKNYVDDVFINRNTASDRMVQLSENAIYNRDVLPFVDKKSMKKNEKQLQKKWIDNIEVRRGKTRLGYFSGSITHNDDFNMILPVIIKVLKKYPNVELYVVGELEIPDSLLPYKEQIKATPFMDWQKLPELIASVDINLVPLENSIFNEAKSENKWVEASLVKVVTLASNVGALGQMIEHDITGLLCNDNDDWFKYLELLICDKDLRKEIAERAYDYVYHNCTTIYTSYPIRKYIASKMKPNIAFIFPSLQISGGILVLLKHCEILREAGYDVLIINDGIGQKPITHNEIQIPVISRNETQIHGSFDKMVASLWSTVTFMELYPNIKERYYMVQGFETDFSKPGEFFRFRANQTYNACFPLQYLTISLWCKKWLLEKYDRDARYVPNGIEMNRYRPNKRDFNKKIRILVEGNSDDSFKNVDESFQIIDRLDESKYEIWYMSYQGKPKENYRVDKFLHRVKHEEVSKVYSSCHILIKSSILESFSYPPLEMMATGGYCVVTPNDGNVEYLKDGENCLFYERGNIDEAVRVIEKICSDAVLREKLYDNGIQTVMSRDWSLIKNDVLELYDVK